MKSSEYKKKSVSELLKEEATLRGEIAKLRLEVAASPQKDTNLMGKKRHALAMVRTFISELRARAHLESRAKQDL